MAEPDPNTGYPVFVTERSGAYELRIRELILVERAPNLQKAYGHLTARKQEIVASARALGTVDELPEASPPPSIRLHRLGNAHPRPALEGVLSKLWQTVTRNT
jgi:hypothetical protein